VQTAFEQAVLSARRIDCQSGAIPKLELWLSERPKGKINNILLAARDRIRNHDRDRDRDRDHDRGHFSINLTNYHPASGHVRCL
jgi:hypothetical protein